MEQDKRGRGRPKIDTHITEAYASSRRQAVNAVYMYEGVDLISVAATEIPDSDLLWYSDASTQTAGGKQGILEQLGRMLIQDKFSQDDCITRLHSTKECGAHAPCICTFLANCSAFLTSQIHPSFAIQALKAGHTSREIEKAIRKVRLTNKKASADPEKEMLNEVAINALNELQSMGMSFLPPSGGVVRLAPPGRSGGGPGRVFHADGRSVLKVQTGLRNQKIVTQTDQKSSPFLGGLQFRFM